MKKNWSETFRYIIIRLKKKLLELPLSLNIENHLKEVNTLWCNNFSWLLNYDAVRLCIRVQEKNKKKLSLRKFSLNLYSACEAKIDVKEFKFVIFGFTCILSNSPPSSGLNLYYRALILSLNKQNDSVWGVICSYSSTLRYR